MRKLRVLHVIVKPVLVWDDGEQFEAGPDITPAELPVTQLAEFAASLPAQVLELAEKLQDS